MAGFFAQHFLYKNYKQQQLTSPSSHNKTNTSGGKQTDLLWHTNTTTKSKTQTAAQDLCLQLHGSTQDRDTVTDCSFTVHRGTDQRHTKSRGKPWQHTATKSSTTTMKVSSEAESNSVALLLSSIAAQSPAKQVFTALQQTNNTKGINVTVYSQVYVCLRTHTHFHTPHSDTHTHTEHDVRVQWYKGNKNRGSRILSSQSWRHTHEGVEAFLDSQHPEDTHPEDTHTGVLRWFWGQLELTTHTKWERGRKGGLRWFWDRHRCGHIRGDSCGTCEAPVGGRLLSPVPFPVPACVWLDHQCSSCTQLQPIRYER